MRKLTVGLMVLGLLVALAGPATAQIADPLGLITSGVVLAAIIAAYLYFRG